jgi:hypothetical protein
MSRYRNCQPARPPRRQSHGPADQCLIVYPPTGDDDVFFGFCENLGLWRIKAPPFDAHGSIDPAAGLDGFDQALADAAAAVRANRPDLADHFQALLDSRAGQE